MVEASLEVVRRNVNRYPVLSGHVASLGMSFFWVGVRKREAICALNEGHEFYKFFKGYTFILVEIRGAEKVFNLLNIHAVAEFYQCGSDFPFGKFSVLVEVNGFENLSEGVYRVRTLLGRG